MLILSAGTGLLGMLAAASGAPEVICIERSRFLYRMAKQALQANPNLQSRIILVGRRLQACGVEGDSFSACRNLYRGHVDKLPMH